MLLGALLVAAVLLFLVLGNPVGLTRARRGLRYRVGRASHAIPDNLQLPPSPPRLIREAVLTDMARVLEYADDVLTRHGIPYWISCGTLLGAMRHQGFIPWDDDIDVQVELSDRPRLLALEDVFRSDGFILLEAAGGYKLARHNFWRFPYIDLAVVDRVDGTFKLCYPLTPEGQGTFAKAVQWPNECLPVDDVFPLARVPFESFSVAAPGQTMTAVHAMYGDRCLTDVHHGKSFMPWVVNHRTDSLLFKLGLIPG